LPRDKRAKIKSASVISAPAASRKAFVADDGMVAEGRNANKLTMSVAESAQTLMVSSERRGLPRV